MLKIHMDEVESDLGSGKLKEQTEKQMNKSYTLY